MTHDMFGQPVSLTQPASVSEWDAVQRGFLAHAAVTPEHLGRVLAAEPDFALGHAVKGLFYLLLGRRELYDTAREAHAAARKGRANRREALYVTALAEWLAGYPSRSVTAMEQVLDAAPGDALAMKLSHAIRFVLGDGAGMRTSLERVQDAYGPDHPARGYFLGCMAFALEETGDYTRAEIAGRQALWTAPNDAWGLHAVAHVHDMTARTRDGLNWLAGHEAAWSHCNNFRYHVWWHKALMHLDLGEVDEVLALYDTHVRADHTDDYRDISNGASLLMRLELEGIAVGDRWEEMAEISASRTEDGCLIFADLHYLLALAGGGRSAESARLLARVHADARNAGQGDTEARMAAPGCDAATGLVAFSEQRFGTAFTHLARARGSMQLAGGSHAQRDVFERMTVDAGLRAGWLDEAEHILAERAARRGGAEDGYAAARRKMISEARDLSHGAQSVPAQ